MQRGGLLGGWEGLRAVMVDSPGRGVYPRCFSVRMGEVVGGEGDRGTGVLECTEICGMDGGKGALGELGGPGGRSGGGAEVSFPPP
jgi:hypothetical protein